MEAAVEAAQSGLLTTMFEAAKTLLEDSVVVSYDDVQVVADRYGQVLDKKRSILRILTNTVHFSCELSEKHLETINGRRTRLANRMIPVIQSLVALWDKVKLSSPGKTGTVSKATNALMAMAEDICQGDTSGIIPGVAREASAVSDSGFGSNKTASMENLILGSQEDETDAANCNRLTRDLDSAVLIMDKYWIPSTIPVIIGEVTEYSKSALESVAYNYEGHCRTFIHVGLIYARRRPTNVHSTAAGVVSQDLLQAFNRGYTTKEFVIPAEPTADYINRQGCGFEVTMISDGGLQFSFHSPHFPADDDRPHPVVVVEVSFTHENWLGFFLEASTYLGPSTNVRFFVGARIFVNENFRMQLFIIKKRPDPKSKEQIMGGSGGSSEGCKLSKRPPSTQVGATTVCNAGLYQRSIPEINTLFDIDIIHVINVTAAHFDQGVLRNPERVVIDLPLRIVPGDDRVIRIDFNETVVHTYAAWRAYMHRRAQRLAQGQAEVAMNLGLAFDAAQQGEDMPFEQQGEGFVAEQQDEAMAVDDDQEPNEPDEQ